MSLNLKITTKIPHDEVSRALDEFVKKSFEMTKGKSVSEWKGKSGEYWLTITYMPQNFILDKVLRSTLEGSFRKQDETAEVKIVKKVNK